MPGCVLRAGGESFDVDEFLRDSALRPCHVFRKGDPGCPASWGPSMESGFNVPVSDQEGSIAAQVPEALEFLSTYADELSRLTTLLGAGGLVLDFGSTFRDVAVQCERFPSELVMAAGRLGIALEVSLYPPSRDEGEADA